LSRLSEVLGFTPTASVFELNSNGDIQPIA
jgi:hypothetical protein